MRDRPAAIFVLIPLLLAAACSTALAGPNDYICQVTASDRVEVASPVPGILETIAVDRGDRVVKGQVLLTLRADVERAEVELAQARAAATAASRSKANSSAFAQRKYERNLNMRQRDIISENEMDQITTERDNAALDSEAANDALKIAALELARTRAQLAIRTVVSPTDGLVTARNLTPGNLVGEKPILVIERTDPLYIEVALPVALFGQVQPGGHFMVTFAVPGIAPRDVAVSLVDTTIDAASNTFGTRLVLPNPRGDVPAGAKCQVHIGHE